MRSRVTRPPAHPTGGVGHPFERTPTMSRRKKQKETEEGNGDQQVLFEQSGKGDGLDEEMQKIMQALGIEARPSVEIVSIPVKSLIIPRATLPTVTEEA